MAYTRKPLPFIQVPQEFCARTDLSSGEKLVLGVIIYLTKKNGHTRAGNAYIAQSIGLSEGRVAHILSGLKSKGFIKISLHRTTKGNVWDRDFQVVWNHPRCRKRH